MRMCRFALVLTLALPLFVSAEDGERYALLIGVNEYNANSNLAALKYAETDMTQLAKALVDAGFKPENIRLMIQGEISDARFKPQRSSDQYKPRKQNIESELDLLLKNKRPDDTVVIAFAGHGLQYRDKEEVYYCPADAKVTDTATLLELTGIVNQLKDSSAGAKLLIADCCRNNPLEEGLRADLGLKVESATRMVRIKPPETVATLFSCGKGEFAREEKEFNGGVFTHYLVEGLRGKAAQNGIVEIAGLASYVQYNVFEYVRKKYSVSQTPDYKLNLGRPMILARGLKQAVQKDTAAVQHTAEDPAKAAVRSFTAVSTARVVESNNIASSTVDTEGGLDYTWTVNGNERTLSLNGVRLKKMQDGVLTMDYFIDKDKALGKDGRGVTTEYTEANLPANFKTARAYFNVPLYKVELDDNGKVTARTPLLNQTALAFLDTLEWGVVDSATSVLNPFMADQEQWTTDAEIGIGFGLMAKGTMTMKKVPGGTGGQAVEVSGRFTKAGFTHPVSNVYINGITITATGTQIWDAEAKEWISGQYRMEMTSSNQNSNLKGVGQSKFQRR